MPNYLNHAKDVIQIEIDAIYDLVNNLDESFSDACKTLIKTTGRIIVIGMGKSGHIGHKIAATLASTGSPAFFVHPGEASHGDFGMITARDSILALSYSGNTQEIVSLLPLIKRLEAPLISITGNPNSELAKCSDIHLNIHIKKEACPLNLAPTASTTAMLVMGDALAISLLSERGFTAEQFAFSHPGGSLGKRLLLSVDQLMSKDDLIPLNNLDDSLEDAIINMNQKALGMTVIIADKKENNNKHVLAGILTDGDLRRAFSQNLNLKKSKIKDIMTKNPVTITPNTLASDALIIMKDKKITSIVITDSDKSIIGVIHLHHLLKAGLS